MNSNTMVTVICITYNHRDYIRRCLDSLINQNTDFTYEIVVHDDASTDGTREIVQEYADRYPDLVIPILEEENQYSKGFGSFTSTMMAVSSGKYMVEIEGDDYWCDPDKLRLQVEALEAHPECTACVHATVTVNKQGEPQSMHFPGIVLDHSVITTEEYMRHVLGEGEWLFHLSSYMVPEGIYREYSSIILEDYPSKFYQVGDLPMFLFFALQGDIYFIDRPMTVYTVESGGIMSRIKSNPEFAAKVHQGFIDGLTAFDEFSEYRFHEYVSEALVVRRFEVDRINRRFDLIVQHPEYRSLVRQRGVLKTVAFTLIGHAMLLYRKVVGRR